MNRYYYKRNVNIIRMVQYKHMYLVINLYLIGSDVNLLFLLSNIYIADVCLAFEVKNKRKIKL